MISYLLSSVSICAYLIGLLAGLGYGMGICSVPWIEVLSVEASIMHPVDWSSVCGSLHYAYCRTTLGALHFCIWAGTSKMWVIDGVMDPADR